MDKSESPEIQSVKDIEKAIRPTVIGHLDDVMTLAHQMLEGEPTSREDFSFVTREPQFGVDCDVVSFRVTEREAIASASTEEIRIYRPVNPSNEEYERDVLYWVELAGPAARSRDPSVRGTPEQQGLFFELTSTDHRFVKRADAPGGDVLSLPEPIDLSTGNFLIVVEGLIIHNGDNIIERYGTPPPVEPERCVVN
ncbi:MAG: hypothetical protein GY759_13735 [Chloroflexi bacterium]|nr:hypothetical protein [Chloroflexota bacterium]